MNRQCTSKIALVFFLAPLLSLYLPTLRFAEASELSLDPTRSEVRAKIYGPLVNVAGDLALHSGSLRLDTLTQEPKEVRLRFYPQAFNVDAAQQTQLSTALLQAVPRDPVDFRSREISKVAEGKYKVVGQSQWGERRYDLHFIVEAAQRTASISEFLVRLRGPIPLFPNLGEGLAKLGQAENTEGALNARLHFSEKN